MKKQDESNQAAEPEVEIELFDPFAEHFISQNGKNDFLKWLEEGQHETA